MIFLKKYYINTTEKVDCIAVTPDVKYAIRDSTFASGIVSIIVPEGGAGLIVIEPLPALLDGVRETFKGWPAIDDNAKVPDSRRKEIAVKPRLQGALLGSSLTIPFNEGKLLIDPYSEVVLVDFEPASRRSEIIIQVMGESTKEAGAGGAAKQGAKGPARA